MKEGELISCVVPLNPGYGHDGIGVGFLNGEDNIGIGVDI